MQIFNFPWPWVAVKPAGQGPQSCKPLFKTMESVLWYVSDPYMYCGKCHWCLWLLAALGRSSVTKLRKVCLDRRVTTRHQHYSRLNSCTYDQLNTLSALQSHWMAPYLEDGDSRLASCSEAHYQSSSHFCICWQEGCNWWVLMATQGSLFMQYGERLWISDGSGHECAFVIPEDTCFMVFSMFLSYNCRTLSLAIIQTNLSLSVSIV